MRRMAAVALVLMVLLFPSLVFAQPLPIKLVSFTSPVSPGQDATLTVQTTLRAACSITVIYKSGPSRAAGLVTKTADTKGVVNWIWRVGTRTTPGRWPITITCSAGSQVGTLETSFVVR